MGSGQSSSCKNIFQNPDILNVVTLSDSAVQRLPLDVDDNPLDKESRNQNIDDFWRDRLDCLEQTFAESKLITEKEFHRLEFAIKKLAPGSGKMQCPRQVEDAATCYLVFSAQPLKCEHLIKKMQLCMDTLMSENSRKKYLDELRKEKKKC